MNVNQAQVYDLFINLVRILVIILIGVLAAEGLSLMGRRFEKRLEMTHADSERLARLRTFLQLVRSGIIVLIIIFSVLSILKVLNIDVTPLIAGAGILGLVISFGAQALVGDLIMGILLLLEDQFRVGDNLKVGDIEGRVERITQRVTYLRSADGRLTVVPHGAMRVLTNLSRDWSLASVDLDVPEANYTHALSELQQAVSQAQGDPAIAGDLLETPQVTGWSGYKNGVVQVRITARVRPGRAADVAAVLRRYAVEKLE